MTGRGRKPDERRYRQVVEWIRSGKSHTWISEQLGLKRADALIARAKAWDKRNRPSSDDRVTEKTLVLIDQIITDGLKVQAEVVKAALAETRGQLETLAAVQTKVIAALSDLASRVDSRPAQVAQVPTQAIDPAAHSRVAPATLWIWIINELTRELGTSGLADELGVTDSALAQLQRGSLSPSAKLRDRLRELLATVWARDLFDDSDELLDARERLPTLQAGHA